MHGIPAILILPQKNLRDLAFPFFPRIFLRFSRSPSFPRIFLVIPSGNLTKIKLGSPFQFLRGSESSLFVQPWYAPLTWNDSWKRKRPLRIFFAVSVFSFTLMLHIVRVREGEDTVDSSVKCKCCNWRSISALFYLGQQNLWQVLWQSVMRVKL